MHDAQRAGQPAPEHAHPLARVPCGEFVEDGLGVGGPGTDIQCHIDNLRHPEDSGGAALHGLGRPMIERLEQESISVDEET